MLVTYAGVPLPKCSVQHRQLLEGRFRPDSIGLWDSADLAARREHWTFAGARLNNRPIVFDSIYWPTGAMRWAVAHFLVTEAQLTLIREATTFGGSSVAATLSWGPEDDAISTEMYMLPAIPISQVVPEAPRRLYLLTLVDERYFWWFYKADIDIDEPCDETWAELFEAVGTALGITITTDGIESAYLKPCHQLSNHNDPLPQQLDAMAYSVGQRIVRSLDGTVTSQSYANAKDANDTLAAQVSWNRAGGFLLSLPSGDAAEAQPGDVPLLVPSAVVVSFPRYCSGWYDKEVSLSSLALTGFTGIEGFVGQKCFHDTAVASGTGTPSNQAELDALATQHARDWYRWQTGRVSAVYTCLRNVTPHGLIDSIEWVNDDSGIYTVVRRPPFDDKAEELLHCGAAGCSPDCPQHICGRAEVKCLTAGCVEPRARLRKDICGRAEVKSLTGNLCVPPEDHILILLKASQTSAQTVTANTSENVELTDADAKDTHSQHDPSTNPEQINFSTSGKGWYHIDVKAEAEVTFSGSQVPPELVRIEATIDDVAVLGLDDCDYIAKLTTPEGGTGTGTVDSEFTHVCLGFSGGFEATTTAVILKIKAYASASLDTDFSKVVVTVWKLNRGGSVAE